MPTKIACVETQFEFVLLFREGFGEIFDANAKQHRTVCVAKLFELFELAPLWDMKIFRYRFPQIETKYNQLQ
jgi:hypothetical protein